MRILLVAAANSTNGGGEKHVADLLRGLVERGFTVAIAAPAGGDLQTLANSVGVAYFPVDIASGVSARKIDAVRRAIASFTPDIVHAQGTRAALFARLAEGPRSTRVVYTVHGIHVDKGFGSIIKLPLERALKSRTAHFITVCTSDLVKGAKLRTIDSARTSVIYNGVKPFSDSATPDGSLNTSEDSVNALASKPDFRQEIGVDQSTPLVLHVGRASVQKDQATLFRAFALVLRSLPSAILAVIITGPSEDKNRLLKLAEDLGIAKSIKWLEPRQDLTAAYTGCDVFALSSLWEGFPYVIVEAMNAATAIVSTDVDGIPEAITSGVEGELVSAGDDVAFAAALARMLELPSAERAEYGRRAQLRVKSDFSLDQMVDQTVKVYATVVRGAVEAD